MGEGPRGHFMETLASVKEWLLGALILLGILAAFIVTSVLGFYSPFHGEEVSPETSDRRSLTSDQERDVDPDFCQDPVPWSDASSAVGERVYVEGPLVSVKSDETATFMNIGADYPDPSRFTVVIWHEGRLAANFDSPTEVTYSSGEIGPTLCVFGEVTEYQGVPQIAMTDMSQMRMAAP